mmetsp:Transcript_71148/g.206366  ORF Transcript_71148/g.206366 Transcript_71148/m.206366 type:complete len:562 (-) Transcript_71148:694-2379(-)
MRLADHGVVVAVGLDENRQRLLVELERSVEGALLLVHATHIPVTLRNIRVLLAEGLLQAVQAPLAQLQRALARAHPLAKVRQIAFRVRDAWVVFAVHLDLDGERSLLQLQSAAVFALLCEDDGHQAVKVRELHVLLAECLQADAAGALQQPERAVEGVHLAVHRGHAHAGRGHLRVVFAEALLEHPQRPAEKLERAIIGALLLINARKAAVRGGDRVVVLAEGFQLDGKRLFVQRRRLVEHRLALIFGGHGVVGACHGRVVVAEALQQDGQGAFLLLQGAVVVAPDAVQAGDEAVRDANLGVLRAEALREQGGGLLQELGRAVVLPLRFQHLAHGAEGGRGGLVVLAVGRRPYRQCALVQLEGAGVSALLLLYPRHVVVQRRQPRVAQAQRPLAGRDGPPAKVLSEVQPASLGPRPGQVQVLAGRALGPTIRLVDGVQAQRPDTPGIRRRGGVHRQVGAPTQGAVDEVVARVLGERLFLQVPGSNGVQDVPPVGLLAGLRTLEPNAERPLGHSQGEALLPARLVAERPAHEFPLHRGALLQVHLRGPVRVAHRLALADRGV